jgi:putative acetyltransferase
MNTTPRKDLWMLVKQFSDCPLADEVIARAHLKVRLKQREDGESTFSHSLYSSQADLTAINTVYVKPGGNFFVAMDTSSRELAGFVGIRRLSDSVGKIKRMAVMPTYRRMGVATLLIQTAVAWAGTTTMSRLELETGSRENAMPIYRAVGFEVVGFVSPHDDYYSMAMNIETATFQGTKIV